MITYKIDKHINGKTNAQIRDLSGFLSDVSPTLHHLQKVLIEHEAALSSGPIDKYRKDLLEMVTEAIDLTSAIADNTQKLAAVSDQAAKHLAAMDDHFSAILTNKSTPQNAQVPVQQLV